MSEQWQGLYNLDAHTPMTHMFSGEEYATCSVCRKPSGDCGDCRRDKPCTCCLVADVEATRKLLANAQAESDDLCAEIEYLKQMADRAADVPSAQERAESAERRLRAVRTVCDLTEDTLVPGAVAEKTIRGMVATIRMALEGDIHGDTP